MKFSQTLAAILVSLVPGYAGDLAGQIIITKPLTRKTVSAPIYNLRGAAPAVSPNGGAAISEFERTVVMLEGVKAPAQTPVHVTIEQRNSRFEPDLVAIPVGSTVEFPNSDPIFHNVFSLSGAQPFDLGFYARNQNRSVKFNRGGIVQVYCHIHSNMYAAIVVTSSPWAGKPDADGTFLWRNIPPGHYTVAAWHKIAGLRSAEVDVPEVGTAHVKIRIPVEAEPRR